MLDALYEATTQYDVDFALTSPHAFVFEAALSCIHSTLLFTHNFLFPNYDIPGKIRSWM